MPIKEVLALLRRERILTACALLAFSFAGVIAAAAAVRGSWSVPPEGRLLEAVKFEIGVGIYFLTLALLVPLSNMTGRARKRWLGWTAAIALYFIPIEAVQALRGLDPRFTVAGGVLDQVAGSVFGVTAIGVIVLFIILAMRFFRDDVLADQIPLRLAIRYGIGAIAFAFGTGVVMSILRTRIIAETGDLMPLHAAGFHGIQAVPLIALLSSASSLDHEMSMRLTHSAGIAWLMLCVSLLAQALSGVSLFEATGAGIGVVISLLLWIASFTIAAFRYALAWRRPAES